MFSSIWQISYVSLKLVANVENTVKAIYKFRLPEQRYDTQTCQKFLKLLLATILNSMDYFSKQNGLPGQKRFYRSHEPSLLQTQVGGNVANFL